uniref:Cadherin domain-containing protein n=1 Tax=Sphaeramia orbicularis TaxID=375764 RepID=A0A672ZFA1_9TELE
SWLHLTELLFFWFLSLTGSVVCAVKATDEDIEMNAELHYSLYGPSADLFSIDPYSGTVFTSAALRRTEDVILNVHVEDAGENPKYDFTTVSIRFQNVSEFPEIRVDPCEVFENSPPSWVCDVLAIDADSGIYGTVQYNITEGNMDYIFIIDPENGLLSTTASLDRENIPEFNLTVEAAELDNPLHKDRATVIVSVLDRNDNAPRFAQIFISEVPEDAPIGQTVIQVTSTDDDTDAYAGINYSIRVIAIPY